MAITRNDTTDPDSTATDSGTTATDPDATATDPGANGTGTGRTATAIAAVRVPCGSDGDLVTDANRRLSRAGGRDRRDRR